MNKKETFSLNTDLTKLKSIFDEEFVERVEKLDLTPQEVLSANNFLAEAVYGSEVFSYVSKNDNDSIMMIYHDLKNKLTKSKQIDFDLSKIGLVLVRPEIYERADLVCSFIQQKGLSLLFQKDISPSLEQYICLYPHGICYEPAKNDFPSRTFNYVDNKCKLFVFYGEKQMGFETISDYLNSLKGKLGTYRKGTIRSEIAYNELIAYIERKNKFKDGYNALFDPIGIYRMSVDEKIENDNNLDKLQAPLLFYAGQAVHVPNGKEIERDFSILLNKSEIDSIKKSIQKQKNSDNELLGQNF